jgi:hypothetical protein
MSSLYTDLDPTGTDERSSEVFVMAIPRSNVPTKSKVMDSTSIMDLLLWGTNTKMSPLMVILFCFLLPFIFVKADAVKSEGLETVLLGSVDWDDGLMEEI